MKYFGVAHCVSVIYVLPSSYRTLPLIFAASTLIRDLLPLVLPLHGAVSTCFTNTTTSSNAAAVFKEADTHTFHMHPPLPGPIFGLELDTAPPSPPPHYEGHG